jgi:hypothetical protein
VLITRRAQPYPFGFSPIDDKWFLIPFCLLLRTLTSRSVCLTLYRSRASQSLAADNPFF